MISRVVDALVAAAATIAAILGLTTLTENASWLGRAVWACLAVAAAGPADAPADLGQGARPARTGRAHRLDRRGAVRRRPALVRAARPGGVAAGRRARQRVRGGDAAVCGADPRDRGRPVRPRRRHRRAGGPRRLPRGHRGDAGGRGTAAARRVPDRGGQRRLLAVAVVLRRRRGDVAGPRRSPGSRAGPALVDHRRQPAHAGRRHRRREPGDVGVRQRGPAAGRRRRHRGGRPAGGHPAPADPVRPRRPRSQRRQHRARRPGRVQLDGRPDPQPAERRRQHRHDLPDVGPVGSPAARRRGRRTTSAATGRPVRSPPPPSSSTRVGSSRRRSPVADRQLQVESNYLSSPNVASVAPVVATDFGGTAWYADPATGDLYAQARPDSYSLTYREVDVTPEQLQAGIPGAPSGRNSPDVQSATTVDAAIARAGERARRHRHGRYDLGLRRGHRDPEVAAHRRRVQLLAPASGVGAGRERLADHRPDPASSSGPRPATASSSPPPW